jgi:hypothetical protein
VLIYGRLLISFDVSLGAGIQVDSRPLTRKDIREVIREELVTPRPALVRLVLGSRV